MKRVSVLMVGLVFFCAAIFMRPVWMQAQSAQGNQLRFVSRWTGSLPPQGGGGLCESIAFDAERQRLYVANSATVNNVRNVLVEVVDVSNVNAPTTIATLNLSTFGADVSSVAFSNGVLAAAMIQATKTDSGRVVLVDVSGTDLRSATSSAVSVVVGAQPDMITFSPDGKFVLTANEGEPSEGASYFPDPEGSVSIIDLPLTASGRANLSAINQASVRFVRFSDFNAGGSRRAELADSARLHYPSPTTTATVAGAAAGRLVTFAQDVEPEYITVSADSRTAFVTLQENNAWAIIDIPTGRVRSIRSMGFKDHSRTGNGFDASDRSSNITIANWNVLGMYQPDAIASYVVGGKTFIIGVNEGDTRAYTAYNEEIRVGSTSYVLDPTRFPARDSLKRDSVLGRLNVTRAKGDTDGDGDFDEIYLWGGRSISVWDENGALVWDSGDAFERVTAQQVPQYFNCSRDNTTRKNRSDDKGPEPEGITIGRIGDSTYCYAGLERTSGIMVFNVTDPAAPRFVQYISTRDYSRAIGGDVSTEALLFVPPAQNRLNRPLVIAAHEVSGTVSIFSADNTTTSVVESALEQGAKILTLAPNVFQLEIPTFRSDAVEILVSDVRGETVAHHIVSSTAQFETIRHTLDLSRHAAGAYFVTMRCGARTLAHKLISQR